MLKSLLNPAKYRKKGAIWGYVIVFVIIVLLEIVIFSTQFHQDILRERSFMETYYLVKGSQLDTYVKAYLSSVQTSLLQAIYDVGCKKNEIWQIYDDRLIPSKLTLEEQIRRKTQFYSNIFLKILGENEKGIGIPGESKIGRVEIKRFTDAMILPLTFNVSKKEINITYTFSSNVTIKSSLPEIYTGAERLIYFREIGEFYVRNAISSVKSNYSFKDEYTCWVQGDCTSCKGCPSCSCEDVFKRETGFTISEAENLIKNEINKTLSSHTFSTGHIEEYFYPITTKGKIVYEDSCECIVCDPCCSKVDDTCIPCYKNKLTCHFYYYGMAEVLVNITENRANHFAYILYDNCERKKVVRDFLRFNFRVIDGGCKECKPGLDVKDVFPFTE
jgi:hypothetical protein